jgi:probable O-glycosylation ligase (exosortase A-associated)
MMGLLAFVFYGFFAPQTWAWSIAKGVPHSQILTGCTIIGYLVSSEKKKLPVTRESALLMSMWIFFGITTVFAENHAGALDQFILFSKILFMALLSTSIVKNQQQMHMLLKAMALGIGLYGLKGALFFLATGGTGMVEAPEGSFLSSNNSLALALVVNLPIIVYLIKVENRPWLKLLLKGVLASSYIAIIGCFSRGAWLAAGIVTLMLFRQCERKAMLIVGAILTVLIATIIVPTLSSHIISKRVVERYETLNNIEEDNSSQSRLWSWEFCKRVGLQNPVLGAGFNYYSIEAYEKYYPEMLTRWPGKQWSCHSIWFSVFSEHGIVGFLIWISLLGSCFMTIRLVQSNVRGSPDESWGIYLTEALKISLMGFIIGGSFLDFAYFDGYYQIIGLIIIAKKTIPYKKTLDRVSAQTFNIEVYNNNNLVTGK